MTSGVFQLGIFEQNRSSDFMRIGAIVFDPAGTTCEQRKFFPLLRSLAIGSGSSTLQSAAFAKRDGERAFSFRGLGHAEGIIRQSIASRKAKATLLERSSVHATPLYHRSL